MSWLYELLIDLWENPDWMVERWFATSEWLDQTYRSTVCRFRGHPGVTWFNANGLEPNMECTRCGKDLG